MALELYVQPMSIYQSTLGPTHPDTINTLEKIKELTPHSSQHSACWWWTPIIALLSLFQYCFPPAPSLDGDLVRIAY